MPITDITIYHLEMTRRDQLRAKRLDKPELEIIQAQIALPELNRFLYTSVGGDWYWMQRVHWSYEQWMQWLDRPEVQTWVAYMAGTPAGFFELEAQPDKVVEIAYFGIIPRFVGQGLGGHLLTTALEQAWDNGAQRVWLHTCTLDHPAALSNYQARGMRIYFTETVSEELPENPLGPWPGFDCDSDDIIKS